MERLTNENHKELGFCAYVGTQNPFKTPLTIGELAGCLNVDYSPRKILEDILNRLAAYEDTGLEPEAVTAIKNALMGREMAKITEFDGIPVKRLQELAQAEKDGRLVVLDEPRKPLVWGDDKHDSVLCPNCNQDLMGGFLKAESCENPMYQCPYCGCSVDGTKVLTREEAEAEGGKKDGTDRS